MSAVLPAEVSWLRAARIDLLGIAATIGIDSPAAAARIVRRIERKVALLADQPRLGARCEDLKPDARRLVDKPYMILYRILPDSENLPVQTIEIVDVIDGRRDLRRVLARRPR